ncbi:HAD-IIA family hydrolase [Rhodococcus triatomae]|uniref:Haloacid Dehalogenase Superfamily Class (Subfamily) IIA n=1 Tax=Rhodococcus triatomae TaxID=300028 RepID=A0A1G8SWK9_9NOCA|nr:HAD-IIA family hydrolase [Rhodococcus triatomae]QNG18675.1 HAD-IIA family hydrolase [Rhodococcus triatomae]QNG25413.1 HAD-IIA family hydrolase [Rhodococcus triatomae]SDJ33115.1 Haloacid Dehalogenase Superfamily Class (subfamily) IIA [Rhodococcus triatomae]
MSSHSPSSLSARYDALLLDLDGTLYQGAEAVPGAVDALSGAGAEQLYVTNNASRGPAEVAEHLCSLGFDASEQRVVTSAQSAAGVLAQRIPPGSPVLVVGAPALVDEVSAAGLVPVREFDDGPVAVVQGHSPETGWRLLAEATLAIRAGALWVATNVDSTLPTERGLVLGNGSMVAAVRCATGVEPVVAGKPAEPLMRDAQARSRAQRPLVVGDRLDTDIEGAVSAGFDSLLVLTGVSTPADVLRCAPGQRPTFLAEDLSALGRSPEASRVGGKPAHQVTVVDAGLDVSASGDGVLDRARLLRDVSIAAWQHPGFEALTSSDPAVAAVFADWGR